MSTLKRHYGRLRNTDRRCIVVYMQIPNKEDHALVVDTDALPDSLHDALQDVVQSHEGQQTIELSNLLSRRIVPHLGIDIMNVLHKRGSLQAVPVDNVVMYPLPNSPIPLRQVIEMTGKKVAGQAPAEDLQNRYAENQKASEVQSQVTMAVGLIRQAEDLENEARAKRERAYNIAPSLRPQAPVAPVADGFDNQVDAQITMFDAAPPEPTEQVTVRPSDQ